MNIKEARQMLESHSIYDDYSGFRTVHRKRKYSARATYIATGIKAIKEQVRGYHNFRTVNHFVIRKVDFNSNGTYVISDVEGLIPIAEVNEGMTVGDLATHVQRNANHTNDIKDRLNKLFTLEGDLETRWDSRRIFNTRVNEALGLSDNLVNWNNSNTAPEFTVTLTLAEVEALLAKRVGA